MFHNLYILIVITILFSSCSSFKKQESKVEFSKEKLKTTLVEFIEATKPNRSVGKLGHNNAQNFLRNKLQGLAKEKHIYFYEHHFLPDVKFAVKTYEKDFSDAIEKKYSPKSKIYKKWDRFTKSAIQYVEKFKNIMGVNFILEIQGSENKDIISYLGAHYDTTTHNHKTLTFTPDVATDGADDNASGVAAALVLAEHFAKHRTKNTIRILFLDFEEVFFLGSYELAKDIMLQKLPWTKNDKEVVGYYNLEMIGYSSKDISSKPAFKLYIRENDPGKSKDEFLTKKILSTSQKIDSKIKPVVIANGFNRSDNWSFWQWNIPSVCITQDWEDDFNVKNYHTEHDNVEFLNIDYMTEITQIVGNAISN
jgi:hypothetical protein